jgi:hypothetical protein
MSLPQSSIDTATSFERMMNTLDQKFHSMKQYMVIRTPWINY